MISIVIPTRNGAGALPELLDAIDRQQIDDAVEVVAVDSASTDGTPELLARRGKKVIAIAAKDFDHGLTRNRGVEAARGERVVLMVQDAVPTSDRWLHELTSPFDHDAKLAGTFARQIPRAGASAIARHYLDGWVAASMTPRQVEVADADEFHALSPAERFSKCVFDNVCSCIKRSVWESHPFHATPIAEDLEWARDVLLAGYRLRYVPSAVVMHSHDRSPGYELARTRILHRRLYELFGMQTIPSAGLLTRAIGSSLALHRRLSGGWRGGMLAFAWPLGQYLGARDAIRQRAARRTPGV